VTVLDVEDLSVRYGEIRAVESVGIRVAAGEIVGIVGESGSGKSTLAHALPMLLPPSARVTATALRLAGEDLLGRPPAAFRELRGRHLAMIFQDPATTFSPLARIGRQLEEFLWRDPDRRARRNQIAVMLATVGIADPVRRLDAYPHELSGGMLQRVAIAAALLMRPALIVADEPTTALDVTTEAQILDLLRQARDRFGTAILIISHHLGVIAELCDRIAVMYAGTIVEQGSVRDVFRRPAHPYTRALLDCEPALLSPGARRLPSIPGRVGVRLAAPEGCVFAPRCGHADETCRRAPPPRRLAGEGHDYLCWRAAS
jgi:oligopeptide/dipeptide ABC transporter ATP-binding protein